VIPQWIGEASLTLAVAVVILFIVKTLGWRKEKAELRAQAVTEPREPHTPCIQQPAMSDIIKTQALTAATAVRTEVLSQKIAEGQVAQGELLKQLVRTTNLLARCAARSSKDTRGDAIADAIGGGE